MIQLKKLLNGVINWKKHNKLTEKKFKLYDKF